MISHMTRRFLPIVLLPLFCESGLATAAAPDAIYVNGVVVTLDAENRVAEGLAIAGDTIVAIGSSREMRNLVAKTTTIHDLGGRTVVPGLYAAHDHFPGSGALGLFTVDLNSPPIGAIRDMADLIAALKRKADATPPGRWVTGRGYDDTLLTEKRHPTRADLDQVSTQHPIWITHVSGHLGVGNSRALERASIDRRTKQPAGGRIQIDSTTGEPNGVIEESLGLVTRHIPGRSAEDQLRATRAAAEQYARQGVTTAVLAGGSEQSIENLIGAVRADIIKFRIVTMTSAGPAKKAREAIEKLNSPLLKAGAIKLLQDGSIQGFTGYLSEPYYRPGDRDAAYRGYSLRSRGALVTAVGELHRAGYQIAVHGNGDQAIDDILFAYEQAQQSMPRPDARHRIEHCQTARDDQLDRMKTLGVTPSFFVGHVYYWGDRHHDIFLGPERAARISPLASALARGVRFTVHDDTPVTPVNPLQLVWVATNRQTTGGRTLGPEQRIDSQQALRAVTADAAWQNHEEKIKGTLEVGKLADFVVLDGNPLKTPPAELRKLRVLQTVVGGRTIYRAEAP
jgi:predicted amidohydrolase YtcJ